jgi:hypothetical protein
METTLPQAREKVAALIERHAARNVTSGQDGRRPATGALYDPMS